MSPQVRKKIEAELKAKIPIPDEEAFEGFVESLRITHPELHRELILGLKVTTRMPAEQEAIKAARRARFRGVFDRFFFLTKWPNQRVLDKKRVVYAGLVTLMVLFPAAYLLSSGSLRLGNSDGVVPDEGQHVQPQDAPGEEAAFGGVSFSSRGLEGTTEAVQNNSSLAVSNERTPIPPETLSQPSTSSPSFTPFPTDVPPPVGQPAAFTEVGVPNTMPRLSSGASAMALPPAQLTVSATSARPEQLTVWSEASASISGNLLVRTFEAPNPDAPNPDAPTQQARGMAVFEGAVQTSPLTAEQAEEPSETELVLEAMPNQVKPVRLAVFTRERLAEQSLSAMEAGVDEVRDDGAARASEGSMEAESNSSIGASNTAQAAPADTMLFQPGMRLPATLVAGLAVTDTASIPVIAETKGNGCGDRQCPEMTWLGTARLVDTDRVEITFTEAVLGNESRSIAAVALDEDGVLGIPVSTQDTAAEVAQALLQSAAGGVSDYLGALANQKRVTFKNDTVIQEGRVPGIETFILGRLAEVLSPPLTPSARVRVATLPAGTRLMILYGVDGH